MERRGFQPVALTSLAGSPTDDPRRGIGPATGRRRPWPPLRRSRSSGRGGPELVAVARGDIIGRARLAALDQQHVGPDHVPHVPVFRGSRRDCRPDLGRGEPGVDPGELVRESREREARPLPRPVCENVRVRMTEGGTSRRRSRRSRPALPCSRRTGCRAKRRILGDASPGGAGAVDVGGARHEHARGWVLRGGRIRGRGACP
jgi:hypothetical protein